MLMASTRRAGRFSISVHAAGQRVWLLLAALLCLAAFPAALAMEADRPGLVVTLTTDKAVYAPHETIWMVLEVSNRGEAPILLEFASAQRFDVTIADEGGAEVWRWSAGRMFAAVLGQETLGPDKPRLVYEARVGGGLEPGAYRIRAWITEGMLRFSGSLGIQVR